MCFSVWWWNIFINCVICERDRYQNAIATPKKCNVICAVVALAMPKKRMITLDFIDIFCHPNLANQALFDTF